MIEIRFKKSTSKTYKDVMRHCRRFEGFTEGEMNVLKIPDAESLFTQWKDFNRIFHSARRWVGFTVYFNETALVPYKVESDWFFSVQDIYNCYRHYKTSYDKEGYCNDGGCWGCKMLKSIERYIQPSFWPYNYWYKYGYFSDAVTWVVDKEKILRVLKEEASHKHLSFCPVFNEMVIEPFVESLPDRIHVDDKNWRIQYVTDYLEDGPVSIPSGIQHTELEQKLYPIIDELVRQVLPPSHEDEDLTDDEANRLIDDYLKEQQNLK